MRLQVSDKAAEQMDEKRAKRREEAEKARVEAEKLRQEQKRLQAEQREKIRAEKRAAINSDEVLAKVLVDFKAVQEQQSERTRKRSELRVDETRRTFDQAKALVSRLERQLNEAVEHAGSARDQMDDAEAHHKHNVVDADANIVSVRGRLKDAWETSEAVWRKMSRAFAKSKRDRALRRAVKAILLTSKNDG